MKCTRLGAKALHQEYWIPAQDLEEFNQNIVGLIEVLTEYRHDTAFGTNTVISD